MSGARETARDAAREAVARAMWERRRINCARHDIILLPWENENAEQRANVLAEADAAIDAFTRSTGRAEPVAWRVTYPDDSSDVFYFQNSAERASAKRGGEVQPLYTAPIPTYADGIEDAAKVAEAEPEFPGPIPAHIAAMHPESLAREACRATKRSIARNIRSLAADRTKP